MYQEATRRGWSVDVIQVAESEGQRVGLGKVDLSYHRYPYELLYRGSLDHVPLLASLVTHFRRGWASRADFVIVQGYAELRNWAQLAGLILGGDAARSVLRFHAQRKLGKPAHQAGETTIFQPVRSDLLLW